MKASEAIGKKVFYLNPNNVRIIENIKITENGKDKVMFLACLDNGATLNTEVLRDVETKELIIITEKDDLPKIK